MSSMYYVVVLAIVLYRSKGRLFSLVDARIGSHGKKGLVVERFLTLLFLTVDMFLKNAELDW